KVSLSTMSIGLSAHIGLVTNSAQGVFVGLDGAAALLQVDGVTFPFNFSNALAVNIQKTSSMDGYIQNCIFDYDNAGVAIQMINTTNLGTSAAAPFLIQNNKAKHAVLQNLFFGTGVPHTGTVWLKMANNTTGDATAGSACDLIFPTGPQDNCDGIDVRRFGT